MKKIKIFLASSITDLEFDRIRIGDFIRQLNEIYLDRGVYFSLIKCDDYDNAIAAEGKQSQFDREIRDSELCFFLFFKKVGDYTRHEFEVALDAFKNSQKPKIVTYFKYIDTPKEAEGDVRAFMHMLDGEIKHYYNIYQSIDTLKLGMLMQIKLMNLDVDEPVVENGKVTFGGIEIADTRNLPVFSGNQTLAELKARLEKATKDYYELREHYREALRYLDLAIETYIKLPQEENEEALASLFNNKGFFLCELSENLELGIDCSKKSVALYEKLFSEEKCLVWEVANAYDTLADLYQKTGNDTEWLEAAKKAYEHALKCPEDEFCKKIIEKYERRLEK